MPWRRTCLCNPDLLLYQLSYRAIADSTGDRTRDLHILSDNRATPARRHGVKFSRFRCAPSHVRSRTTYGDRPAERKRLSTGCTRSLRFGGLLRRKRRNIGRFWRPERPPIQHQLSPPSRCCAACLLMPSRPPITVQLVPGTVRAKAVADHTIESSESRASSVSSSASSGSP